MTWSSSDQLLHLYNWWQRWFIPNYLHIPEKD